MLDLVIYRPAARPRPWTAAHARTVGRVTIIDGSQWLFNPDNWPGANGIGQAVVQHLWYSVRRHVAAIVIALPIGLAIGHTGRGGSSPPTSPACGGRSRRSAW